ncbi:MAG: EAL domain-containing protein [Rhizobiaceae bacterium]
MSKTSTAKSWAARLFIAICVIIIIISFAIMLVRFNILQPLGAILTSLVAFFGFFLIQRQSSLSNDIKMLKEQPSDLVELENRVDEKFGALTGHITSISQHLENTGQQNTAVDQAKLSEFEARLAAIEKGPSELPSASMAPFHEAKQNVDAALPIETDIKPAKASIISALEGDNLQMHLQPIVGLPSRRPDYFEAFMRLKTEKNEYLDSNEFNKLTESGGLLPAIDTKILFSSARLIRTLEGVNKSAGLFCTLSASTFENAKIFEQIIDFLEANKSINGSLILEISQRDYNSLKSGGLARLGKLADLGFALSLGHVADLNLKAEELAAQGFQFLKVPVSILLHADLDEEESGIRPTELASILSEQDITLIALEIEREDQAMGLIDIHVSQGQGILFAPPRAVKTELLDKK